MGIRRVVIRCSAVVCLSLATLSCSDDSGGGGGGGAAPTTVAGMLGLVPDTAAVRGVEIYYSSFERIRVGLPAAGDPIEDLISLTNATDYQANVPSRYQRCIPQEECLPELGWDTRSIKAWIEFGEVSQRTEALVGSFSPSDVESAIRNGPAGGAVETSSVEGVTVIAVGAEGQTELAQRSGYSQIGRGVTVAVDDALLVSGDLRADVEGVLTRDASQSIAQDPSYAAVANALDEASVDYAVITPGLRGTSWQLAGFGEVVTADDDGTTADPTVVTYVFVFADDAAAQAGEAEFRSIVATGESASMGIAWSERLTISSTSVEGNVVVVTMQADGAGWWLAPLRFDETLLAF